MVAKPTATPADPQSAGPAVDATQAQALLRECYALYRGKMLDMVRGSLELTNDLFEGNSHIPEGEVESFRGKRGEWLALFDRTLADRFDQRVAGERRRGRRPDADASLATLRVLTPFDHEKQASLKTATEFLGRFTRRELAALDLRVDILLPDTSPRDIDNPFAVNYILDALGASARAIYPNPRVWRPFMERLLADLTPGINKLYISINRYLADRGVLPEIKAALRARSEFRPFDDKDLFPTFSKMLHDADVVVPTDVVVPETLAEPGAAPALVFTPTADTGAAAAATPALEMSGARILAGLAALAASGARANAANATPGLADGEPADPASPGSDPGFFPSLDPLMALGSSSPLFATLAHWQRLDLPAAIAASAAGQDDGDQTAIVPRNLIPHIRAAVATQISNDTDRITMDVIALLFDYVFRDGSIPDDMRSLFGRLQVPVVKAALLDRTFFSDKGHPARRLLDHLADASVGATQDDAYRDAFRTLATDVVETICRDFEIDVEALRAGDAKIVAFIEGEKLRVSAALIEDVAAALDAESADADRSFVRAYLRDRLAGIDLPFEIRAFVETVWADHLTLLRQESGADSQPWAEAVRTLDDLLWSILVKERAAQKARLTKMIPGLIGALRKGCASRGIAPERTGPFFEALYALHMAAIRPTTAPASAVAGSEAANASEAVPPPGASAPIADTPRANVHDYVSEMAVGTWIAFGDDANTVNARLGWVSPMRTKYLFTSRSRTRAFVYTPEELAYALGSGKATLVVEPVPLFDRAVSAALDTLGARQPPRPLAA